LRGNEKEDHHGWKNKELETEQFGAGRRKCDCSIPGFLGKIPKRHLFS